MLRHIKRARALRMIIIAAALKNLLLKPSEKALPGWIAAAILVGAGILHGLFISGGALLVLYPAQVFREKSVFRANASAVWTVLNIFLMLSDLEKGLFTGECLYLTAVSIPPAHFRGVSRKQNPRPDQPENVQPHDV